LIRAFEKSNVIYMLSENYPQMIFNREAKRICDSGTLGKILYAEGEYNHPGSPNDVWFKKTYAYHRKHWRNFLPRTYYITHSLGPVMWVTGATPKKVTAFATFAPYTDENLPVSNHNGDMSALIMTQNDDGSVFRVTGCAAFGGHHNAYRFCGTNGQIENLRGMGDQVMLRYNGWQIPEGAQEVQMYEPSWNDKDEDLIKQSGHGGADYLTVRTFYECVLAGKQPEHPFDIYSAVNMSSVALLSHRSMLEGGVPYDIPDFHLEECRQQYENDRLTPFYGADGSEPTLPCCSHPDYAPTERQQELNDELLKS
jgi:predicted dehydrogenase